MKGIRIYKHEVAWHNTLGTRGYRYTGRVFPSGLSRHTKIDHRSVCTMIQSALKSIGWGVGSIPNTVFEGVYF